MNVFTLAAYKFSITPDQNAPGVQGIQQATNEVAMYALSVVEQRERSA
jgi:hypothetical protein